MRRLLAAALLLAVLPKVGPASAEELGGGDRQAIRDVIGAQIEAFQADDGGRAFGFATPELQAMFGSAAVFMSMVRQGYAPVYRPQSMRFGEIGTVGGALVQELAVIGPDGVSRIAQYTMEREADGSWRIAGCRLLDRPSPES